MCDHNLIPQYSRCVTEPAEDALQHQAHHAAVQRGCCAGCALGCAPEKFIGLIDGSQGICLLEYLTGGVPLLPQTSLVVLCINCHSLART